MEPTETPTGNEAPTETEIAVQAPEQPKQVVRKIVLRDFGAHVPDEELIGNTKKKLTAPQRRALAVRSFAMDRAIVMRLKKNAAKESGIETLCAVCSKPTKSPDRICCADCWRENRRLIAEAAQSQGDHIPTVGKKVSKPKRVPFMGHRKLKALKVAA